MEIWHLKISYHSYSSFDFRYQTFVQIGKIADCKKVFLILYLMVNTTMKASWTSYLKNNWSSCTIICTVWSENKFTISETKKFLQKSFYRSISILDNALFKLFAPIVISMSLGVKRIDFFNETPCILLYFL